MNGEYSFQVRSIRLQRLPHGEGLPLPDYMTPGAAGMDVAAAVTEPVVLAPGEIRLIPAGFRVAVPPGFELQVRPRSGLALRHGLIIPNSPGTIDSDYRGEVAIIMLNAGQEPYTVARGLRLAQLVLAPVIRARWEEVPELDETKRKGGFGHTGV
ncbi:MAG: dUTP diphosphatase [Bacillota bacterium]